MTTNIQSLKKIFFVLLFSSLFFLSGCTFFDNEHQNPAPMYIELQGKIMDRNADTISLSEYILLNEEGEALAQLESYTENLSLFVQKSVILKGKKVPSEGSGILQLNVIQIEKIPEKHTVVVSKALGVSLTLSPEFFAEEKDGRFHILKQKTEEEFFTVFWQKNEDWQEKFVNQGEKIVVKDFDVRRIYSGKRIQLYFPESEIQMEYWGEKNGEYDFYNIIETLVFSEKTKPEVSEKTPEETEPSEEYSEKREIKDSSSEVSRKNTQSQEIIALIDSTISKHQQNPENSVHKISLYDDFADVEISERNAENILEKQRIIYKISESDIGFKIEQVAEFTEGEVQSWELVSGTIPALAGESEIFLGDVDDVNPIVLPENFALYVSTHFNFQVGYPRSMYYGATGKTDTTLASVSWSSSPLTPENAEIRLEIIAGEISEEKIVEDENTIVFPRDSKTHFKFSALHDNFSIVQEMKKNFRNEQ